MSIISDLKSNHGWRDKDSIPDTEPNTLSLKSQITFNSLFSWHWSEIGRPPLEENIDGAKWALVNYPSWDQDTQYRIKGDPHWKLRNKWLRSRETLPIETFDSVLQKWYRVLTPKWYPLDLYREAGISN